MSLECVVGSAGWRLFTSSCIISFSVTTKYRGGAITIASSGAFGHRRDHAVVERCKGCVQVPFLMSYISLLNCSSLGFCLVFEEIKVHCWVESFWITVSGSWLYYLLVFCSMEYYMQKTFYKTASLMANSCKSIAVLAGQPQEVALLAFDYGRHLVCCCDYESFC